MVWFAYRMTRSSQCDNTARDNTARSTSAAQACQVLDALAVVDPHAVLLTIGPSSRVSVT